MMEKSGTGVLYIVPTPVGNLDDMTFRAVQVLKEAGIRNYTIWNSGNELFGY